MCNVTVRSASVRGIDTIACIARVHTPCLREYLDPDTHSRWGLPVPLNFVVTDDGDRHAASALIKVEHTTFGVLSSVVDTGSGSSFLGAGAVHGCFSQTRLTFGRDGSRARGTLGS